MQISFMRYLDSFKMIALLALCFSGWAHGDYIDELDQTTALQRIRAQQITVIDVRSVDEYASAHVISAINIPHDDIKNQLDKINGLKDKPILLYCASGRRAERAQNMLSTLGFTQLYHLKGDMQDWQKNGLPTQP